MLFKTHTAIEKLSDGSCIKRITETRNGKTEVKEEKVDCEAALQDARGTEGKEEVVFKEGTDEFDKKMKEKLNEMNKSFSNQNKPTLITKEETYTDGTNKTVKVTRESSSIEETKKTEKIPDGTKRTLKITRESFLEETKKSVKPDTLLSEEMETSVKMLDESFNEEAQEKPERTGIEKDESDRPEDTLRDGAKGTEQSKDEKEVTSREIDESEDDQVADERLPNENMELEEADDNILKRFVKAVFKILFYPLFALNIL